MKTTLDQIFRCFTRAIVVVIALLSMFPYSGGAGEKARAPRVVLQITVEQLRGKLSSVSIISPRLGRTPGDCRGLQGNRNGALTQ